MPCKDCHDENLCDRMGLCQVFAKEQLAKPCTCHSDDSPPKPCARKYALSECQAVAKGTDGVAACPVCKGEGPLCVICGNADVDVPRAPEQKGGA